MPPDWSVRRTPTPLSAASSLPVTMVMWSGALAGLARGGQGWNSRGKYSDGGIFSTRHDLLLLIRPSQNGRAGGRVGKFLQSTQCDFKSKMKSEAMPPGDPVGSGIAEAGQRGLRHSPSLHESASMSDV